MMETRFTRSIDRINNVLSEVRGSESERLLLKVKYLFIKLYKTK